MVAQGKSQSVNPWCIMMPSKHQQCIETLTATCNICIVSNQQSGTPVLHSMSRIVDAHIYIFIFIDAQATTSSCAPCHVTVGHA